MMSIQDAPQSYKYCVLLTATIDPKGMTFTRRANPKQREGDYLTALKKLSAQVSFPIIFSENSGYDLSRVKQTLNKCASGRHEVISNAGNHNLSKRFGKGYGEMNIIRDSLKRSSFITLAHYVIKLTGRYTVTNLKDILSSLEKEGDFFVAADYHSSKRYTFTGMFVCKPDFFSSYLLPLQQSVDDSKGQHIEMALYDAIEKVIRDGHKCVTFPVKPRISGISGTWNVKIDPLHYDKVLSFSVRCKLVIGAWLSRIGYTFSL